VKTRLLTLWIAAVAATAMAFVVHLGVRLETVRLGYEVGDARQEQRRLAEMRRLLAIEAATLRQSSRIEIVARRALRMDVPDASRIVPMGADHGTRVAGRVK
jgi:cell division protein FtsL